MFRSIAKYLIPTIVVLSHFCILTDSSDGETRWIDDSFGAIEKGDVASLFLNFGRKRNTSQRDFYENLENVEITFKNKTDILSRLLKLNIDRLRNETDEIELVFLIDASGSVGLENFRSELDFVKKLLSDFTVQPTATRVAVVTFGGRRNIRRNIDEISRTRETDYKCYLLNKQLNNISYTGGGTYTRGALKEALAILEKGRKGAKKAVFLITDGFSNGGDPRPAANLLKSAGATVFTFGIRTGNVEELHDIASSPGYTHSYLLDSFAEFEALARRALHRDLKSGQYVEVVPPDNCNLLCANENIDDEQNCCDDLATCSCGIATGHYACICPAGYFGSGFKGSCKPCPNGTYASGEVSGDSTSLCISCPDANHITIKLPATSIEHCVCASGFVTDKNKCEVITCPKLKVPENGYLVKANACTNVVHAACGIRCRIGFYLTGDSIRLCGKDGTWSGNEPKCLLKTCPALRAPAHGRMRCQHEEYYQHRIKDDAMTYPIDTRCQFRCESGYQLRGSKIRNCLPLSQWDGLKASCKATKCEPLKQIANGQIEPANCSGPEKISFATNCTISCKKGFALEGPRFRSCGGRTGVWTQRHSVNRCIDKTPPSIICPSDISMNSLPKENYAYVSWSKPKVTDNADESPVVWTKPYVSFPWKVRIGTRTVVYVTQDSAGNKARCKLKIKVLDKEPPMIENCIDPPVFFTDSEIGVSNVTWDEPGFYDNSKAPVRVDQSHRPGENTFPIGSTKVFYNATDKYDNIAICVLNITVTNICRETPKPYKGYSECSPVTSGETECTIACEEGYGFALESTNFKAVKDEFALKCNASNINWDDDNYVPDCSETYVPKTVSQEGSIMLEGNTTIVCDNRTTLRELSEYITEELRLNLLDICGNDIECNLISFDPECEESLLSTENVYSNLIRRRRDGTNYSDSSAIDFMYNEPTANFVHRLKRAVKENHSRNKEKIRTRKKKEKIEIKFRFIGRIIEENFENPRQGIQKLKQKMASLTQSGKLNLLNTRTNQEIAKLALNLHLVFKDFQEHCDPGSVLKKYSCVKCPTGTFYDSSSKRCYPCSFGEYENISGSLKCKRCPERTFTKKMHAKSLKDCIPMCKPGYYSKRKRYHRTSMALEPCLMCDVGFYQPDYGQTRCLSCPFNKTTEFRASTNINDCVVLNETGSDVCQVEPCLNGGQCVEEEDSFSCECRDHYIGSKCETFQNPCDSSPCLNEGVCEVRSESNGTTFYSCTCKSGYVGSSCELYIDECANNPCQNNGRCISTESDYTCECNDGFEGQFCEIPMDHCDPLPCEEGSTCRTVNETWQCFCKPGFLGRHCNLLPCDWLPCHSNALCINIEEENATRMSYRCECPDGYTGENCTTKIDYCENSPCLNNGECIGGIYNYTCTCPVPFTGKNCETGKYCQLSSDYVMHFVKSGTTDYISMKGPRENLSELTACLWLQSKDTFNYGTVLSYATRYHDNAFTLTDYNGFVIYINGQKVVTDIKVNDGHWHFFCITWDSENGHWKIFIDGFIKDTGFGLSKRIEIPGNGSLVIGQEQDRLGGGFSESESFLGKLSLLDIWSTVLKEADIKHLFNVCEKYHGSVIAWSQLQEHVYGDVAILKSPFCRGCPSPVIPFRGSINASEDLSEVTYYCDAGYIVRFHGKENRFLKIKCMKQGQWEGYHSPICVKRRCGSPGYFPRGRIHGRSYFFGDEIHYSCMNGYELRGNPHRICNSEGKWSGLPPICIGKTCKNLLAPENGDIEYVIEENERDDISILQAGQQLEFKCDPGFRLEGENFLTCLESGIWDHDRPTCVPYGCSPPQKIDHGDIIFTSFNYDNVTSTADYVSNTARNNSEREYHFGDVVGFSCHQGYKFRNNQNLAEFRIECSENGSWSGYVPDCVSLKCPWPNTVKGGRLFLQMHDDDIEIFSRTNTSSNVRNISLENVNNNVAKNETVENMFVPGSEILVKCDLGYELIGESIRKCTEKEEWSSTSSYCKPRECDMKDHPLYQFFNSELISENYTERSSQNGNIKQSSEKSQSGSYRNLKYFIEGNSYMEQIIVTCKDNSKMDLNELNVSVVLSNLTWTCNVNGEWEIDDAKLNDTKFEDLLNDITDICQKVTCPSPTVPEYGYIINDNTNDSFSLINSTVVFKCRNGFILEGNEKIVCLSNGSWTALPSCKPVICGTPTVIPNASLKEKIDGNFTFGNMITYQCVPGYLMFGQSNARCLANGKWSRVYSKCSKLSCNKPKLLPGATVYGRSYLYQDQLTYVCPNGKKRGLITCKADGKWSDPPICTTI